MGFVLNIEAWQKPDTVQILPELPEKVQEINNLVFQQVGKFAPANRSSIWFNFYDKTNKLEEKLYIMEQLIKQYTDINTKPIDRFGIVNEYKETAEYYNLLIGFECMEVNLINLKLNIQITNNVAKKVVINL